MAEASHDDTISAGPASAKFDIAALLLFLWQRKLLILGSTVTAFFAMVIYLNFATYRYSATLIVTPAQTSGGGGLSGSLGALASLAGADLSRGMGGSSYPLYLASLKSRGVAVALAADPAILHYLFANDWDAQAQRWEHSPGLLDTTANTVRTVLGLPVYRWTPPGPAEVQTYLEKQLQVVEDLKRSMTTIRLEDKDPAFAALMVARVHEAADKAIRRRTIERSSQYVAYLEKKLPTITIAEQRNALVTSLNDQEKLLMQASANGGFAAEPLNGVEVSQRPVSPRPMVLLSAALVLGFVVGIGAALAMTLFQRPRSGAVVSGE